MGTTIKKMLGLAALLSVSVNANAYDFETNGIYYNILSQDNKTVEVTYRDTEYKSYSGDVVIPEKVTYNNETYSVTTIGQHAFYNSTEMTSVEMPDIVTTINEEAFYDCTGLTSIVIPKSLTSIGNLAFSRCTSLTAVHISDLSAWLNIEIDASLSPFYAFSPLYYAKNLYLNGELVTDLVIPDGTTEIKDYVFQGGRCIKSVTIPNSVTSIGVAAFDCDGLTAVNISDLSAWLNITFTSHNYSNPNYSNPLGRAHNLYLNGELVTNLVIPDGITEIKDYAFENGDCISSVTIPNRVTSIGEKAFSDCSNLTSIEIPNSVTSIGTEAFKDCGLASVEIPGSVASIGQSAFRSCGNLLYVTMLNGIEAIGDEAFSECINLTSVVFPNSITTIKTNTFWGCYNLATVTIPNSVTSIGTGAFQDCSSLASLTIPSSVTSIEEAAFHGCIKLAEIYSLNPTPPTIRTGSFDLQNYTTATLTVPEGSLSAYHTDDYWSFFQNIRETDFSGAGEVVDTGISIIAESGKIVISGADNAVITVYNTNGQIVYNGTETTVNGLARGIYIVQVGEQTFKVAL